MASENDGAPYSLPVTKPHLASGKGRGMATIPSWVITHSTTGISQDHLPHSASIVRTVESSR